MKIRKLALFSALSVSMALPGNANSAGAAGFSNPAPDVNTALASAYRSTIVGDGAIVYYPLADSTSVLRDSGPNGRNGKYGNAVAHNGPTLTGMGTPSASFSGGGYNVNKLAAVPITSRLQPANAVSIEGWVSERSENTTGQFVPVIVYGRQSIGPAYSMTISPQNTLRFWAKTSAGAATCGGYSPLIPGAISHFVTTYDGNSVTLYVNGHAEASCNGHGTMNYTGLSSRDGLAIGGALDVGLRQFDGSIAHVAIYGRALPATTVIRHFVVGAEAQKLIEPAYSTNQMINSIGVNVHLHYTGSVYDRSYAQIRSLLLGLGVRHIRDGLVDTNWQPFYDRLEELARAGIKSTLTTTRDQSASLLTSYPKRIPLSFEGYEGPNEQNIVYRSDSSWPQKARAFQKMLYSAVKGNRATAGYRVIGPSITSMRDMMRLGDISSYMDDGNVHDYFASFNPGTEGFGSHTPYGIVGSMPWNANVASIVSGRRPIVATETGYNTGLNANYVPSDIQARYIPRLMMELYNHGIDLSEIYELVDWNPTDHQNNYGLVASNLRPKPAYYALQNLISLLKDPATPSPLTVSYALSGDYGNVHHTIMRKSDGSFYLALWIEKRDFVLSNGSIGQGTRVHVDPQTVVVTFPKHITSGSIESIGDSGTLSRATSSVSGSSITVPITNNMSIVRVTF